MEQHTNTKKNNLLAAVLFGVYSSLLMYLGYNFEFDTSPYYRIVNYVLAIAILYYVLDKFRVINDGLILKQALKIGLFVGVIGGLIYGIYTFVHVSVVDNQFLVEVKENLSNTELNEIDGVTSTENQKGKDIAVGLLQSPYFYVFTSFIGSVIQAFVISLVIGLIKKR